MQTLVTVPACACVVLAYHEGGDMSATEQKLVCTPQDAKLVYAHSFAVIGHCNVGTSHAIRPPMWVLVRTQPCGHWPLQG